MSNNIYTDIQTAINYLLYHNLYNQKNYNIIKEIKKSILCQIHRLLYYRLESFIYSYENTSLISIFNKYEFIRHLKYSIQDRFTFYELCANIKIPKLLLLQLANNKTNSYVVIATHIAKQVCEIIQNKINNYNTNNIIIDTILNFNNYIIPIDNNFNFTRLERLNPGSCIIIFNFLSLFYDDQRIFVFNCITDKNNKYHSWIHINNEKCKNDDCACVDKYII
jgi:hypothetical protein